MSAADYGLGKVEELTRSVDRPKRAIPAGSEPCGSDDTAAGEDGDND